jgi:hypothetical protein
MVFTSPLDDVLAFEVHTPDAKRVERMLGSWQNPGPPQWPESEVELPTLVS